MLRVAIRSAGERDVCIEVEDNGVGIAPEHMTKIFGHGFTTRRNGHGFGLHNSANAAQTMSGRLTAHSDGRGQGARFVLQIPRAVRRGSDGSSVMAEPRSAAASDGAPEAPGIAIGRNGRILLVDDNRAIHEDFRKVLGTDSGDSDLDALHEELFGAAEPSRAQRFELDSAFQGDEGLQMARAARRDGRPYALAFVDVRMPPGIDGVETTRAPARGGRRHRHRRCARPTPTTAGRRWRRPSATPDRVLILKKPFDTVEVRQLAHALERRWELAQLAALKLGELETLVDARTGELRAVNTKL